MCARVLFADLLRKESYRIVQNDHFSVSLLVFCYNELPSSITKHVSIHFFNDRSRALIKGSKVSVSLAIRHFSDMFQYIKKLFEKFFLPDMIFCKKFTLLVWKYLISVPFLFPVCTGGFKFPHHT